MRIRLIVVSAIGVVALSGAAVVALGSGTGAGIPEEVAHEAKYQGLDPYLLGVLVEREGVSLDHTGSATELRSAARRLRRGIDRHQTVVGAIAATRAGDEQVSRWLADDPVVATSAEAIPDPEVREFVLGVLAGAGVSSTPTGTDR